MKKYLISFVILIFILILYFGYNFHKFNDHKLHIVVCDVGQGDAIFIITPANSQFLIDGGPDESVLSCLNRHMPFWDRSIDAVILTHPHADHLSGLLYVLDRYKVDGFYTEDSQADSEIYRLLKAKLANKNLSDKDLTTGDVLRDESGIKLKILWPRLVDIKKSDHNISNLDLNGLSLVLLLDYGNFSGLFTGDAGQMVMDKIGYQVGDLDFLKVPHHGSKTGFNDKFLSQVKPEVAAISVGKENRYGHPAKITLELLKKYNVKAQRTDLQGEVELISNGKSYYYRTNK